MALTNTETDDRRLLLIRHARTRVEPDVEPSRWPLDDGATAAVRRLAMRLSMYHIRAIVTSSEPKAIATGRALGAELAVESRPATDLHEHERGINDFVADQAAFEQRLGRFFRDPDEHVWDRESAREAQSRFAGAIGAVLQQHTRGNVAIVAHGTVITLFVALHNHIDPLAFWRGLGMPACVVLELPMFRLEGVETIRQ